jgi:hypothetical protein
VSGRFDHADRPTNEDCAKRIDVTDVLLTQQAAAKLLQRQEVARGAFENTSLLRFETDAIGVERFSTLEGARHPGC